MTSDPGGFGGGRLGGDFFFSRRVEHFFPLKIPSFARVKPGKNLGKIPFSRVFPTVLGKIGFSLVKCKPCAPQFLSPVPVPIVL